MLVLGQHAGDIILVGDDIVIQIVSVCRGQVKLGFTAPKEVRIRRIDRKTGQPVPLKSGRPKPPKP